MAGPLPLGDPAPADGRLPADLNVDPHVPFSAYLHVPFCRVRCGYCDFNTYTSGELRGARQDQYADTLITEIALARRVLDEAGALRPMDTVFFGGGTPTLLPAGDLAKMLDAAASAFGIADGAEVTVEANPDTVTPEVVRTLVDAGVTRLSIGMQSAVPHVLAALDRTHQPENVRTAVDAAKDAGLAVSVDLIYGAPGETLVDWEASLDAAIALESDHISAYALIIEDGTKLARQIRRGEVVAPDDDLQADMYELVDARLAAAGFDWYEVSNWAKQTSAGTARENRSRHTLAYWRGQRLVGIRSRGPQSRGRTSLVEREASGGVRAASGGVRIAGGGHRTSRSAIAPARARASRDQARRRDGDLRSSGEQPCACGGSHRRWPRRSGKCDRRSDPADAQGPSPRGCRRARAHGLGDWVELALVSSECQQRGAHDGQ